MISIDDIQVGKIIYYKGEKICITEIVKTIDHKTYKIITFKGKTDHSGLLNFIINLTPLNDTFATSDIRWTSTSEDYKRIITFANEHVNRALMSAYKNAKMKQVDGDLYGDDSCVMFTEYGERYILDKESILDAYPLGNIK
jgi:hypothetical protein